MEFLWALVPPAGVELEGGPVKIEKGEMEAYDLECELVRDIRKPLLRAG